MKKRSLVILVLSFMNEFKILNEMLLFCKIKYHVSKIFIRYKSVFEKTLYYEKHALENTNCLMPYYFLHFMFTLPETCIKTHKRFNDSVILKTLCL